MKTYTIFIFALSIAFANCNAQPRQEVAVGFGPYSSPFIGTDINENLWNTFLQENDHFSGFYKSGNFTYRVHFDKVSFGVTNGISGGEKTSGSFGRYDGSRVKHITIFTCFEPTFYLRKTDKFQLYALGGLGIMKSREELTRTKEHYTYRWLTMQITPVGVRFGKDLGVFAEIGYGYKGLLNMGTSLKF